MNRIPLFASLVAITLANDVFPLPLDKLMKTTVPNKNHFSNEYTGWAKFDPRDYEANAAKSVGNYTTEKVDLIGADVTILTSYEYDTGYLRVFGTLDKKFKWHVESNPNEHYSTSSFNKVVDGKKEVHITQSDKCASEWDKNDVC